MELLKLSVALLPFAVLLVGFIVFRMSALKLSFYVWMLEVAVALILYHMGILKLFGSSIWGNLAIWSGFAVLYTGQIFGQNIRSTGILKVMLDTLGKLHPSKAGRAVSLSSVVGGFVGAFNGFATYPVTIPGLVELGISGMRAAVGYLVYFSWSIAFVSLFIAATIASRASGLPIAEIAQVMGLFTIPLVVVSVIGFFRIMKFDLGKKENLSLALIVMVGNIAAIVLFTQVFTEYYILTLIASSTFCLLLLYAYRLLATGKAVEEASGETATHSALDVFKAFAPLAVGVLVVVLWKIPAISSVINGLTFKVGFWGYKPFAVTLFRTPGFYVLVTALSCYLFAITKGAKPWKDLKIATKRSADSLMTLFCGGAMVYLMVDTGQIALLAKSFASWGGTVYAGLLSGVGFLAGIAFGQGLPACFMFAKMQVNAAQLVGLPLVILVGIAALVTMGPPNPLKPSLIRYTSSLANIKGKDGEMFRMAFPWQILQLFVIVVCVVLYMLYVV